MAFVGGEIFTEVGTVEAEVGNEEPTRLVEAEALRPTEPPPEPEALRPTEPDTSDQSLDLEPPSQIPGQVELPGQDEIPGQERLEDEVELEAEAEMEAPAPSESLEELIAEEEPFPEDSAAPPPEVVEPPAAEAELTSEARPLEPQPDAQVPPEPETHVPDPPPPPPEPGTEPPGRARGRVDVPTQEHPPPGETGDLPSLPGAEPELGRPDTSYEPPPLDLPDEEPISEEEPLPADDASPASDAPRLYDFETDEEQVQSDPAPPPIDDDFEALGPAEEEAPYLDEEEPYAEEPGTEIRPAVEDTEPHPRDSSDTEERSFELEEEEGEDDLWFEKGPPKDFDFDD